MRVLRAALCWELRGGGLEGSKASRSPSFLEGTFIILSYPPSFLPGGLSLHHPACLAPSVSCLQPWYPCAGGAPTTALLPPSVCSSPHTWPRAWLEKELQVTGCIPEPSTEGLARRTDRRT